MGGFKGFLKSIVSKVSVDDDEPEDDMPMPELSYSHVPLTLELRKRKFQEELYEKHGICKKKTFEIH